MCFLGYFSAYLCRTSWYIVRNLKQNFIEGAIIIGDAAGKDDFISMILVIPTIVQFEFNRAQYPHLSKYFCEHK